MDINLHKCTRARISVLCVAENRNLCLHIVTHAHDGRILYFIIEIVTSVFFFESNSLDNFELGSPVLLDKILLPNVYEFSFEISVPLFYYFSKMYENLRAWDRMLVYNVSNITIKCTNVKIIDCWKKSNNSGSLTNRILLSNLQSLKKASLVYKDRILDN